MDPDTRMAVSLVLSLAVSARNLQMAASGHADIVDVGLRYVAGFLVIFVLVGVAGRLVNDYLRIHEERRQEEERARREAEAAERAERAAAELQALRDDGIVDV